MNTNLQIFNNVGKFVSEVYVGDVIENQKITIDVSNFESGIYYINCVTSTANFKKAFNIID